MSEDIDLLVPQAAFGYLNNVSLVFSSAKIEDALIISQSRGTLVADASMYSKFSRPMLDSSSALSPRGFNDTLGSIKERPSINSLDVDEE